jgi:poly(3-hydroxybutyrate) depolymerase
MIRPPTLCALLLLLGAACCPGQDIAPIPRHLPQAGSPLPAEARTRLAAQLKQLEERISASGDQALLADAGVFAKAVDLALRFDEFYDKGSAKDVALAEWALKEGGSRLDQLKAAPWAQSHGLVARGYRSQIDGSFQPYGLVIPDKLDLGKPAPLYVWLHGRSENDTDLHFLSGRTRSAGEIHPDGVIMAHAFGRMCVGFKHAGEIDVMDLVAEVSARYKIDPERVVLMGFSMGGAGAKHIGAHYTDHFAAIHAGAGFAETARYNKIKPEDFPPPYEQTLWGVYDVPDYIRNLFNVPFIAYSGEKDPQIQAAQVLAEAFKANGRELVHIIGPGVGHQYQPDALKQVLALVHSAVEKGRPVGPETVSLETRTLRYDHMFWVQALGLGHHWQDARIDAAAAAGALTVTTANITALKLSWPGLKAGTALTIDGQKLALGATTTTAAGATLVHGSAGWAQASGPAAAAEPEGGAGGLRKRHGLQGPIDDAFMAPFLVVLPGKASRNPRFQRWCAFESHHFLERWAALMRGDARVKADSEVNADDIKRYNLVLWGDAESNSLIARVASGLPLAGLGGEAAGLYSPGSKDLMATTKLCVMVYPNPLSPERYVVLNSGLTFREAHDHTNSLQNPKLPDWALLDIATDPDEKAPGLVERAGFFDEQWQVQPAGK